MDQIFVEPTPLYPTVVLFLINVRPLHHPWPVDVRTIKITDRRTPYLFLRKHLFFCPLVSDTRHCIVWRGCYRSNGYEKMWSAKTNVTQTQRHRIVFSLGAILWKLDSVIGVAANCIVRCFVTQCKTITHDVIVVGFVDSSSTCWIQCFPQATSSCIWTHKETYRCTWLHAITYGSSILYG